MQSLRTLLAYSLLAVGIVSLPANAYALTHWQIDRGYVDCMTWCRAHNTTTASLTKCSNQCDHYWYHVVKQPQAMRDN